MTVRICFQKFMKFIIAVATLASAAAAAAAGSRPNFAATARVKQPIHGVENYEICHDCDINDETGETGEIHGHKLHAVESSQTCGGLPCLTQKGIKKGMNKYHLRARFAGGQTSLWSNYQAFEVVEPGTAIQPVPIRDEL
ncbi:hypothetical protein THAOC_06854 [Thalassiosira oceanica]|uniref:Uncharacterized protein n=1 Tax=Thalassiosira oceanica TaxID=159749 RepID=K0SZE5_THAOC|nr:hypothetical protein THAOC_06854 [Thalassiosira oceanica]|eukprot:EJK71683.1 hypothetical protein THAOC_06854 [Thalassiosira oceanica]